MLSPTDLEQRFRSLEEHTTHLEATNQDLSEEIAKQWDQIDRLSRTVEALHNALLLLEPTPEVKKPPHY